MFVRVAERKPDGGVVLRGCKAHQQLGADDGGIKPGDFIDFFCEMMVVNNDG